MRSVLVSVLLCGMLMLGGCIHDSAISELFAPSAEKVAAAPTATVADFVQTYKENSAKANNEYRGRWVKIRGKITQVSKHDAMQGTGGTTYYYVGLKDDTGKTKEVISCRFNFNKKDEVLALKSGTTGLFYGMVEDMSSTNQGLPIITDCLIVK